MTPLRDPDRSVAENIIGMPSVFTQLKTFIESVFHRYDLLS